MVQDRRHSTSRPINGNGPHLGHRSGDLGMLREIRTPVILSMLVHGLLLGGLLVLTPYLASPQVSLPPAQMVQLVDLPSGGGEGGTRAARETPQPPPKKPEPTPEIPKAEKPEEPKPPEPKPEKADNTPPPKPQNPPREPEMALPTPKAKEPPKKEPPKKEPPKREEKKPEPVPRPVAEKPAEKKKETPPPAQTPEPTPRGESVARAQPERPGGGSRPGPGAGPGSGLSLGGGSGMLSLDSANFPFTYYLRQVTGRIEENWIRPQQAPGRVVIYFRIKRDGTIAEPRIHESSRDQTVDLLASGAIKRSEPFPPLPVEFGGDYLGIYLCFGLGSACPGQKEG
jgi:outer membrane biosynthesis protein TonB